MAEFGKEVTTSGAGWHNLLALMQANGYKGIPRLEQLTINEKNSNLLRVKRGHSATVAPVAATDGYEISGTGESFRNIDAGTTWVYTAAAWAVELSGTDNYA